MDFKNLKIKIGQQYSKLENVSIDFHSKCVI
jgi:hypothetical protein